MDNEIARHLQTYYEGILPVKDDVRVQDLVSIVFAGGRRSCPAARQSSGQKAAQERSAVW